MTSAPAPLRLMVLDDHPVVRHGLVARLTEEVDFSVIGSYGSSRELIDAVGAAHVDVVLVDFSRGPADIDGLNLIRALKIRAPHSRTIVVSAHYNPATVGLALKAGARGYVGKGQDLSELVAAVRTVAGGRVHLHREMAAKLAARTKEVLGQINTEALVQPPRLSPREREVLRCYLDGMSVTQIATKFSRDPNTISAQKQAALRKLAVRTDNELFKIRHQLEDV